MAVLIEARQIEKYFLGPDGDRIQVIAPLDLNVYPGEIVALLGPSGSGKSTLVRMRAGLSDPSGGEVLWNRQSDRPSRLAIVFQGFALFPWLTVQENVEAPLEALGVSRIEREERSRRALDTVGLDGFEAAYPKELSGGMKQRVGFARALVVEPEVLFMDEPFSALDVLTAENLRGQVMELWADKKLPTESIFLVTHNIEEAVLLADRIIVLGKNPARIRTDFRVALPQPRDRKSPAFLGYADYIYTVLTQPDAAPTPVPAVFGRRPAPPRYPMLPHVRPGGLSGLLELLPDTGTPTDLYRLAEMLRLEVDDLLPLIEAGELLGFINVREGEVEITPVGREFANADILRQKEIFRDAAIHRVALLDQIQRALAAQSNHRLTEEFFRDLLEEYFTEPEIQRQMDTAVTWGRYAELFDYDVDERRFFLPTPEPEPAASLGPPGSPPSSPLA